MKTFLIIVGLVITLSCAKENRKDLSLPADERLSIYSNILDELVKDHFYNLYLGEDVEKLDEKYDRDRDSPEYQRQLENLKGVIDSDTASQSTICLRHELNFIKWTQLGRRDLTDSLNFIAGLSKHLKDSSMRHEEIYDSLISPQKQFSADRFRPSSYKVKANDCSIGILSFSKVCLNKLRDKGLLYYEFHCGEKCGKGEILLIEKKAGHWTIQKNVRLWIS
jgi:hypothetical protein